MATTKSPFASPPPTHNNMSNSYGGDVVERGEGGGGGAALSRAPSTSNSLANGSGPGANGYFPSYQPPNQQQQQQQTLMDAAQDQTTLNTRANSQTPFPDGVVAGPSTSMPTTQPSLRPAKFTEEWDASQRGSSIIDSTYHQTPGAMQRSHSFSGSTAGEHQLPSRGNTLKKKASLRRTGSLKRSGSRRSMKAGSVRSLALQSSTDEDEMHSAFYCPVPTTGNPTEILANRFQSWRKILKDLIAYFREIQNHYEHRSKSLVKLANVLNNTTTPPGFVTSGGLDDALQILRNYNKLAIQEANKARDIEEDVILALTGLRSDLHQKIKEIKNLAGDFKNTVDKEMDATRRAVKVLQDTLGKSEIDSSTTTGKEDPYLLRLAVDRQLERQIDEENYLHRAYLNLENSGRELESIVVGEVQKAYNAYAGIFKREADAAYSTVEELRGGPIAMPKDQEWSQFVKKDDMFVSPEVPLRSAQYIHYPGRDHFASQEIRAGLLERKSKYLKSYTAGWYVLSPTHLHEFRSADKTQAPVMSLYLPEQKLGSHSTEGASSNKFIIKGRQTGTMHRGHTWVFRAESYDTMMAWYEDIKALTEKSPEERNDFVRGHSRSFSRMSQRSVSSDGVVDEDDDEPFAPDSAAIRQQSPRQDILPRRPSPGGRFPSDLTVNPERGLQVPLSPASVNSGFLPPAAVASNSQQVNHQINPQVSRENSSHRNSSQDIIAAAVNLPGGGSGFGQYHDSDLGYGNTVQTSMNRAPSHGAIVSQEAREDGVNPYTSEPIVKRNNANYPGPYGVVGVGRSGHRHGNPQGAEQQQQQQQQRQQQQQQPAGAELGVSRGLSNSHNDYESDGGVLLVNTNGYPTSVPTSEQQRRVSGAALSPPPSAAAKSMSSRTSSEADLDNESMASPAVTEGGATLNTQLGQEQMANGGKAIRPTGGTLRTDSVPTISNLHIPGQYPKSTPSLHGS